MSNKAQGRIGIGTASLITVFAIMCLGIFSILAISAANEQSILCEKTIQAVEDYYKADSAAVDITNTLLKAYQKGEEHGRLAELSEGTADILPDGVRVVFSSAVNRSQSLEVELILKPQGMEIVRWQLMPISDWQPDDNINVWTGE